MSTNGAVPSRQHKYINSRSAVVHNAWGVAVDDAIPADHDLRRPGHTSLGHNYITALAGVAEKVPDLATAQQLMKEQRDGRVTREVGKQGQLAPHLTIHDLQEIVKARAEKDEEEERKGVQEAFGLRKVRKPSLKAAETAEANKRQKTRAVGQEEAVDEQGVAKPMEEMQAGVKPSGFYDQQAVNDQASVSDLKQTEDDLNTSAGDLAHPSAPAVDAPLVRGEDFDVGDLLEQYGLMPTDERSLIIGLRAYTVSVLMSLRTFTGNRIEPSSRAQLEAAGGCLEWSLMDSLNVYEEVLNTVDPVGPGAELAESLNETSEEELSEEINEE